MFRKKLPEKLLFCSIFLGASLSLYGQTVPQSSSDGIFTEQQKLTGHPGMSKAPNVASFDRIHEVTVDMFNGIPTMYHPLLTAQGDDMNLDIGLNYNGGGVKVNETAGWTGLNWNLVGEYQISRKVNDIPDERFNRLNFVLGMQLDRGYFYSAKEQLNHNNWNASNFLASEFKSSFWNEDVSNVQDAKRLIIDAEPDEFMFSLPGGISGSFYRSEKAGPNDPNGWLVKSKHNLKIDISHEIFADGNPTIGTYPIVINKVTLTPTPDNSIVKLNYLFTKFVITTPDGYRYTFGGVDSALEVTRPILQSHEYMTGIGGRETDQYSVNTWKLAKIQAPTGEEINLTYNRGRIVFHLMKDFVSEVYQDNGNQSTPDLYYSANITYPVYLSKIETSRQVIHFKRSQATEKWYAPIETVPGCDLSTKPAGFLDDLSSNKGFSFAVLHLDQFSGYASGWVSQSVPNPKGELPNYNQQLDSIILFDKETSTNVYGYKLQHSASTAQRRTLEGYFKFNFQDNKLDSEYEFTYQSVSQLPDLFSINRDFWGFPNYGPASNDDPRCGFNGFMAMPHTFPVASSIGYLKSVKNPLGGVTELVYEANQYQKKIKVNIPNNSVDVADVGNSLGFVGPGARIRQIKKQDYFGAPTIVKEYKYISNYPNSTQSSGLLNFDYLELDQITVDRAGTLVQMYNHSSLGYQQYVNQFRGGIVNYSEVVEVTPGNGYTVYKYTNSEDPQYRDEIHAGYGNMYVVAQSNFRLSSSDLDRGSLKQVSNYNNDHQLLKELVMTYENNPNRKNDYVKAISKLTLMSMGASNNGSGPGVANHRAWAYKIYTYKNPLKKTVEKNFSEDGTIAFTHEKNFDYDAYGNLVLETTTTSDGKVLSKATKFNSHPDYSATTVSGQEALGLKNLNNLGIKNYPVEQLVYTNQQVVPPNTVDVSRILSGTEYVYKPNKPLLDKEYALELSAPIQGLYNSVAAPNGIRTSKINGSGIWEQDSRFVLQKSYPEYTAQLFANKPKTIVTKETNEALLWDYSGKYPVASFQNAVTEEVAYTGLEGDYSSASAEFKNGWQFSGTNFRSPDAKIGKGALLFTPSSTLDVNNAFITSTIALQSGRKYRLSFWAASGNELRYYRVYGGSLVEIQPTKVGAGDLSYYETEFTTQGTGAVGLLCYTTTGSPASYPAPVDEIALFPVGTLFKSISHDVATGQVLSVNDGAGHLQLYEYDAFGRLLRVKDENGHLLTDHEYYIQSAN